MGGGPSAARPARRLAPPREARSGTSRRNFIRLTLPTLKGAAVLSVKGKTSLKGAAVLSVQRKKLRARFDAASRLSNLPRAVKRTGRAARALTFFRIFYEDARGRAEGREAAKARARHLSVGTQHAEFILSLPKGFEFRSTENPPHDHKCSRFERKRGRLRERLPRAHRRSRFERKGEARAKPKEC